MWLCQSCLSFGASLFRAQRRIGLLGALFLVASTGLPACSQGDCRYDTDCPDNKICKRGVCTSNLLSQACSSDKECSDSEVCLAASCVKIECNNGEVKDCFEGPPGSQNIGICRGGKKTCKARRWSACEGQILSVSEICNQLDDDCNGKVDDDSSCSSGCKDGTTRPCYTGPTGTQGVGVCRPGSESCTGGAWSGQCVGATKPTAKEVCNDNQDNNCNGQVDEGCGPCKQGDSRDCYTGPANTKNVGTCTSGKQSCQNGQWSVCSGDVKPGSEVCDNKDNDCNGKIDDSPNCQKNCQDGARRSCYNGPAGTKGVGVCKAGIELCRGGKWSGSCVGAIIPTAEKCNDGLDNNCNNQKDENCGVCRSNDQEVCYNGSGGCTKQADGSYRCNNPCRAGIRSCQGGQWTSCKGEIKPKPSETCGNKIDDNCNGQVDEGCSNCSNGASRSCPYKGPAGTAGIGTCKAGRQTCTGGNWGACSGEVLPVPEICGDGLDNNCNKQKDENCTPSKLHQSCTANSNCDTGQVCIQFQGQTKGTCFQDCSSSAAICSNNTDGRQKCTAFARTAQNKTISVCVKEVGTNASCDVTKSIICVSGNACSSVGKCIRVTTVSEGQQCDSQASPPTICGTNLLCVGFGAGFPSICMRSCAPAPAPSTCGTGFSCITLSSGMGACLQTGCTSTSQCRYTNPPHRCITNSSGGKSCYPEPLPGPRTFGQVCNFSTVSTRCVRGLTCLTVPNATRGFCSKDCTSSGSCPSSPSGAQCTKINTQGTKMCLFGCTRCPSGLKCNTQYNACFP